jgi:hypothetical protein
VDPTLLREGNDLNAKHRYKRFGSTLDVALELHHDVLEPASNQTPPNGAASAPRLTRGLEERRLQSQFIWSAVPCHRFSNPVEK